MQPWGKIDPVSGASHHLIHHSADVAATLGAILEIPVFRRRAERAIGGKLAEEQVACLGALAFLHDIGKLAPSFQIKALPPPFPRKPRDHLRCGWKWLLQGDAESALAGQAPHIVRWDGIEVWFMVLFAHHGRPVKNPGESWAQDAFAPLEGYDWQSEETRFGKALASWFPEIRDHEPPPPSSAFAHFFCGLLALADWIGSDRNAFPFMAAFDPDYWIIARERAQRRLSDIGLNRSGRHLGGPASWALVSQDHPTPRPAQEIVAGTSLSENLVILEAETGAGKTEAALWRFAQLYESGTVDSLYFAVPTRAAARQLQSRINKTLQTMFSDPPPEAVLAIPGQAVSGEAQGIRLPAFEVKWDDDTGIERRAKRWAAEHATRFLAAQIAVGTVDQAMMAGLQVKHAHLRGSALSRSLLVIDEVHASDAWMTEIQRSVLRDHLALGGHALLMSATLGAVARSAWRATPLPSLQEAEQTPYPAVWTKDDCYPVSSNDSAQKDVSMTIHRGWSGEDAAAEAISAARRGARVLVIRNTVDRARETFAACVNEAPDLVFQLNDTPTLHHSRFAAEDRALLDARVEDVLGKGSIAQAVIVIGTQTLEQSLDIDADILITDLCPMDVLLQRIGRLHRHSRSRPDGFERASALVLCPEGDLGRLTSEPENGLGAYGQNATLSGVYLDVPGLAATLHEIETAPLWRIPQMNRRLVERATHPERLDEIAAQHGWEDYRRRETGKTIAEIMGAQNVILDRREAFPCSFPSDEVIRTRLGESGAIVTFPDDTIGPFGSPVTTLALPAHWSRGLTGDESPEIIAKAPLTFRVEAAGFVYDASGLTRLEED